MPDLDDIKSIRNFKSLVRYLRTHLGWPVDEDNVEDLAFDYEASELGLDEKAAVKIREIKQIRPLSEGQPWGVFWIDFEAKRLPVVVMRRILGALVRKKRARHARQSVWDLRDLMFISATGEGNNRGINFAYFRDTEDGLPQLRTFSWDVNERHFYYLERVNLESLHWPRDPADVDAWRRNWAQAFTVAHGEVIATSKELASRMAELASATRDLVNQVYQSEARGGPLHKLYDSFKRVLISDLTLDDFADMYAQTVAYGLFSARVTHTGRFQAENVTSMVPNTNPFLRDLLQECLKVGAGIRGEIDLDELGVGELVEALRSAKMEAVLQDFGRQSREHKEDPVVHFYESFLHEYDAEKKAKRGVFYTPDPVVSFIVRSVDYLLRTEFDCPDGLADTGSMTWKGKTVPKIQVLDPALGTGTFLKYVIEQVYDTFTNRSVKEGLSPSEIRKRWNDYVPKHLLPRVYGFELMMAPYAVAHMKLGLALRETEYNFASTERLRVYLTNSLQPAHEIPRTESPSLAHEAEEANRVKMDVPINVVIGNPPYSNFGMLNKGQWILALLDDYKKGLNEKKINLDDDFIKFMRLAQWRIDATGQGILAFITNNTYIDGLTHRRMRESLLESFDKVYILDLHGHVMKKESAPDGSEDQNVFDIRQGVAISIFVKAKRPGPGPRVLYSDLWGSREQKYAVLSSAELADVHWQTLAPAPPEFLFAPLNTDARSEIESAWSLSDIMPISISGVQTKKDALFVDFEKPPLGERLRLLLNPRTEPSRKKKELDIGESDWILQKAATLRFQAERIVPFAQSPFDNSFLYYDPRLLGRARYPVMRHMLRSNIGLVFMRQSTIGSTYDQFMVVNTLVTDRFLYSNHGAPFVSPLYLYPDEMSQVQQGTSQLAWGHDAKSRVANLSARFLEEIGTRTNLTFVPDGKGDLNRTFGPEDVLHYVYAVFYSPAYRGRYGELLRRDFPRVPLTTDVELFRALAGKGDDLVALHLLESRRLQDLNTAFVGSGDSMVGPGCPKYEKKTIWINDEQGFQGVPKDVWEFQVGGYQVCHKWLKDRRGRKLSAEDKAHYAKIVVALKETIRLMGEIDEVIEAHGGWPIQ